MGRIAIMLASALIGRRCAGPASRVTGGAHASEPQFVAHLRRPAFAPPAARAASILRCCCLWRRSVPRRRLRARVLSSTCWLHHTRHARCDRRRCCLPVCTSRSTGSGFARRRHYVARVRPTTIPRAFDARSSGGRKVRRWRW